MDHFWIRKNLITSEKANILLCILVFISGPQDFLPEDFHFVS